MKQPTSLVSIKTFYLAMAVVGAVSTWTFNILAWQELGADFTPLAFVQVGFQGSPILGSVASDFWVGSVASLVWMLVEARRIGMRLWWIWLPLTAGVAWAFALPLFLYYRERWLERGPPPQVAL